MIQSQRILASVVQWDDLLRESVRDVQFDYPHSVVANGQPSRHENMPAISAAAQMVANQSDYFSSCPGALADVKIALSERKIDVDVERSFLLALARVVLTSATHGLVSWQPATSPKDAVAYFRANTPRPAPAGRLSLPGAIPEYCLDVQTVQYDLDLLDEEESKLAKDDKRQPLGQCQFAPHGLAALAAADPNDPGHAFRLVLEELFGQVERSMVGDLRQTALSEPVIPCKNTVQAGVKQVDGLLTITLPERMVTDETAYLNAALDTAAHQIHRSTQRGPGNRLVVGPDVAVRVQATPGFEGAFDPLVGPRMQKIGNLRGRYAVICDPLYPDKEALMVYGGGSLLDAGYAFAPLHVAIYRDRLVLRHAAKLIHRSYARLVKTEC